MIKTSNSKISAVKLLSKLLKPILGFKTPLVILSIFFKIPYYNKKYFSNVNEKRIKGTSKTFLPIISAFYELAKLIGDQKAREVVTQFLFAHSLNVQRDWYLRTKIPNRSWEEFHTNHEYAMNYGIIKNNVHDKIIRDQNTYKFNMVKCSFHEVFSLAEIGWLTEPMCKSDEIVFNEYSNEMKFHRGGGTADTLGRGGDRCVFIFERVNSKSID
ncbi:L-2-amino-thiazoline-4-carboxylic acid hydrolase [Schinkia azotoformans]|uniref:L-2-amino-thiazoline-4-carboxylic acid hydrolase n=1 Tax=Schinkia azotoformans TaxID=1454 RepID=UPI002DBBE18D|nr:L-2-amino-thiazoline-4-carboxylic acid hydrolase [Schinkia azotoformans]MEC1742824.1 L-2-amino-thiazoline-4-carboxylic acid hydrolase [Schinkia azotoformans]MEC1769003.1 L-2-amino-thiazoline-4-carboxylic acid hydrolase [Schinkia azotoformans]MEC1789588.1 L-2-amino-thiazoline-4-carboxylic acid hydrolase [Schinkia azotoformans]MED4378412.1 L-2-amino-thiazoline-4-carboxylic acid hydrolase [Schinkia azotoformans]MED4417444.1 L-2-amino-thiazoline-4-carboxylic acid hydrolase [Schinkia azotoforman